MRRRQLPILLLAVLAFSSCDNDDFAGPIDPPAPTIEEQIIADCYVVRDALEAFAAENGGVLPYHLSHQSGAGNRFVTFLPGDGSLTNRYTGLATVPVFHEAQWPGEIGIVLYSEGAGPDVYVPSTGYRIVGHGCYGELIRLENLTSISQATLAAYDSIFTNCDAVVAAAEKFARQAGQYPSNVGADQTPSGDTMTELLADRVLLTNPISNFPDSPVDGAASTPGQIGYQPMDYDADGMWDSYIVDALAAEMVAVLATRMLASPEDETVRYFAYRLRSAVEEFASENGGEFPRDVGLDTTPAGDTVMDLLAYSYNHYTGASAIQDGFATSRGEVGYVPFESNGVVVGYVINALGLFEEELERFEVLP